MTVFIVVGVIGLLLLLSSLLVGDLLDSIVDAIDIDTGGFLSGPAMGAFLATFGFGAALINYNTDWGKGASALGGIGSGVVVGGIVGLVTRALINTPTDPALRAADLLGARATVVTRIPPDGFGEVTLVRGGQFLKLSARADSGLREGTAVVVTSVLSSTAVVVAPSAGKGVEQ